MDVEIAPADWESFESVMGPKGGCGGCWCMLWRRGAKDFAAGKGEGNRAAMRARFAAGRPPGLVARIDGAPVGWVHVAPRKELPRLAGSRVLKPLDDLPVWSIACLLVAKPYRRQGLSARLIGAAADYAFAEGAPAVEGYPSERGRADAPAVFLWTGTPSAFRAAGFTEAARRSPTRPIMRRAR